jgi:hypothetical protein
MTDDETESNDAFEYHAQVTQHPTTIVEGKITDIRTSATLDGDAEQTGHGFGVVIEDPTVEAGSIWKNTQIPDGFASTTEYNDTLEIAVGDSDYVRGQEVTDDAIEAARERLADYVDDFDSVDLEEDTISGTDYKIADVDDRDFNEHFNRDGDLTGISVGGDEFTAAAAEGFDADSIMVWYGGMAGQFVGRALDFNGMPFARFTESDEGDDPYLLKGLLQAPIGWRGDADVEQYDSVPTTDRAELARDLDRKPRVTRPPVLRDLEDRTFIALGRYNGGNMHEVHLGRAVGGYGPILDALDADEDPTEHFDEVDMRYDQSPEATLAAEFDNPGAVINLYTGEGWMDEPDGWSYGSTEDTGGSFDVSVEMDEDEVEHPTDEEIQFAQQIATKLEGTGATPEDEVFQADDGNVDLEGLVGANAGNFSVTPDVDSIRQKIYENTSHLSA